MPLRKGDPCPVCTTGFESGRFCASCQGSGVYDPKGPPVRIVPFSAATLRVGKGGKSLRPCQRIETKQHQPDRRYSRRKWLPAQLRCALEAETYSDYRDAILRAGQQPRSRVSWTSCRKAARAKGLEVKQSTIGRPLGGRKA